MIVGVAPDGTPIAGVRWSGELYADWDRVFGFAGTAVRFLIVNPWRIGGLLDWLKSIRTPWVMGVALSVSRTSAGDHLSADPERCRRNKHWNDPMKRRTKAGRG